MGSNGKVPSPSVCPDSPFRQKLFAIFLSLSRQMMRYYYKLDNDRIYLYPFHFTSFLLLGVQ
jgi:hypothetical protein